MSLLSIESASLIFMGALVWVSALAQHFANVAARGAAYAVSDRSTAPEMAGFYGRATRTLANNMESALMYGPPTILIILLDRSSTVTHWTSGIYIVARTLFTLSYWLRIPNVRSLGWLAGMFCAAAMAVAATLAALSNS